MLLQEWRWPRQPQCPSQPQLFRLRGFVLSQCLLLGARRRWLSHKPAALTTSPTPACLACSDWVPSQPQRCPCTPVPTTLKAAHACSYGWVCHHRAASTSGITAVPQPVCKPCSFPWNGPAGCQLCQPPHPSLLGGSLNLCSELTFAQALDDPLVQAVLQVAQGEPGAHRP